MGELDQPQPDNNWFSKMHALLGLLGGVLGIVGSSGVVHNDGWVRLLAGLSVLFMGGGVLGARKFVEPSK